MSKVQGARLLAVEIGDRPKSHVARELGVTSSCLHQWLHGWCRPKHALRLRIQSWSRGRIPIASWLTKDELLLSEYVPELPKAANGDD